MQHSRSPSPSLSTMTETALTYDEISMQRGRHFVKALQELKNLRPQLYSAAEYCESSYLYSEQKQVVIENLKDYSVKALVNAVDHLGTVACKLNELLDQQVSDIAATELRVASAAQRLRTCQEYTDHEGLKQQSLVKTYTRHHKHYTFPETDAGDIAIPKSPVPESQKPNGFPREVIRKAANERAWSPGKSSHSDGKAAASYNNLGTSNGTYSASSPTGRDAAEANAASTRSTRQAKASPVDESVSLSTLMSTTTGDGDRPQKELRQTFSRSKNMFTTLLSRKKSFKVVKS